MEWKMSKKKKRKFKTKPKVPYANPNSAQFDKPLKWYPSDDYINNYEQIDWSQDGENTDDSRD